MELKYEIFLSNKKMSFVIVKTKVATPYKSNFTTTQEKVFICTECKRVVVDPVKNFRWLEGSFRYNCSSGAGGCGFLNSVVQIKYYRGDKLTKAVKYESEEFCHPDMFSVSSDGIISLEADLTREGRKSLTDYINEMVKVAQEEPITCLIEQLGKLSKDQLSFVLTQILK